MRPKFELRAFHGLKNFLFRNYFVLWSIFISGFMTAVFKRYVTVLLTVSDTPYIFFFVMPNKK